jgi:Mor family transcriptional regulator
MYIKRFYDEEIWTKIELKSPFVEKYELWISNYGQVKRITFSSKIEKIVNQNFTEGYPSFKVTVLRPITKKESDAFVQTRNRIASLQKELLSIKKQMNVCTAADSNYNDLNKHFKEVTKLHKKTRESYLKKYKKAESKRKINFGGLTHRFVATYFVDQSSESHNLVAHLDYDKGNNHHSNLKWMTREENALHQKSSPYVIKAKADVFEKPIRRTNTKLTITEVMILKKRINEGVQLSKLAKRYKVTETQLLRIKRGINWGKVPAAL